MIIKDLIDEDFVNYKEPSMFIISPKCSFKCCIEAGNNICQNLDVVNQPDIIVEDDKLIDRYLNNPITHAVVIAGLEPFETWEETFTFVKKFRERCDDEIILYSGFWPGEIEDKIEQLKQFKNIIIKYGRFKPNQKQRLDPVLGVQLYEPQWAERIS